MVFIGHENSEARTKKEQWTSSKTTKVEGESGCKPADAATKTACPRLVRCSFSYALLKSMKKE
jgi:hypothetical protein